MATKKKPVYRTNRRPASLSAKIIIVLLILLVLTLSAFLFKDRLTEWLKPHVVYPDVTGELTKDPSDTSDGTDTDAPPYFHLKSVSASEYDAHRGDLIIVDGGVEYVFRDTDKDGLVDLYSAIHSEEGESLDFTIASASEALYPAAFDALAAMTGKYAEMYGYCPLMITSSYRDLEAQREYYEKNVKSDADKPFYELPGHSDHHTGLAFDVKLFDENGASYSYARYSSIMVEWIVENYKHYGFIMRYPATKSSLTGIDGEGNHFRYVGLPHSVYMTENGLCLEEYADMIKRHPGDDPFEYEYNGSTYYIWYCSADDGTVLVPDGSEYTVSGDNTGGFIITAKK